MLIPMSWLYRLPQGTLLVMLKSFTRLWCLLYSIEVLVTFQDEKELGSILSGIVLLALYDSALVLKCLFF